MVGMHQGYWDLFRNNSGLSLYVLEEEAIHRKDADAYATNDIAGLLLRQYQQSEDFFEPVVAWHREVGFDAVVPAWEYGVAAAAAIAEAAGLRWPGRRAIDACTDKIVLREALAPSRVPQPRWAEVRSAAELAAFHSSGPVVVKPSNRRASVGVIRLDHSAHAESAWQECVASGEDRAVPDRPRATRFIAEEYLAGYQVSVETLMRDGKPVHDNVSHNITAGGPYFPVLGVTVPAPISDADYRRSIESSHLLMAALQVQDGMIHSEWKVVDGRPHLIECAARVPGAFTAELAQRAYEGYSMYEAQIHTLAGREPALPAPAGRIATARWFHPRHGVLKAVHGIEALNDPAVFLQRIKVQVGDHIPPCTDSWQRIGYFCAEGESTDALTRVVDRILNAVHFDVE